MTMPGAPLGVEQLAAATGRISGTSTVTPEQVLLVSKLKQIIGQGPTVTATAPGATVAPVAEQQKPQQIATMGMPWPFGWGEATTLEETAQLPWWQRLLGFAPPPGTVTGMPPLIGPAGAPGAVGLALTGTRAPSTLARLAPTAAKLGAAGAVGYGLSELGEIPPEVVTQLGSAIGEAARSKGVEAPPAGFGAGFSYPIKHWQSRIKVNGTEYVTDFWKLANGKMACLTPSGEVRVWRPKKHIVISNNPRLSMLRKLNRVNKKVNKMLSPYTKTRTKVVGAGGSKYLSPAEKQLAKLA